MNRILVPILTITLLLTGCSAPEGIEIDAAWMRPAAQGANGAVYFVIRNHASQPDELLSVSTTSAGAAEIHQSMMNGDVMEMNQVDSVPLPAGAEVVFEPGGFHIMLIGLKHTLKVGDEIEITLHFKSAEDAEISIPVSDMPAHDENH